MLPNISQSPTKLLGSHLCSSLGWIQLPGRGSEPKTNPHDYRKLLHMFLLSHPQWKRLYLALSIIYLMHTYWKRKNQNKTKKYKTNISKKIKINLNPTSLDEVGSSIDVLVATLSCISLLYIQTLSIILYKWDHITCNLLIQGFKLLFKFFFLSFLPPLIFLFHYKPSSFT